MSSQAVTIALLIGSLVTLGSPFAITSGTLAKILEYVKYLKIAYPTELEYVLRTWKTSLLSVSIMPDLPQKTQDQLLSSSIPEVFSKWGISATFLANFWQFLLVLAVIFGVYCFVKAIEKCLERQKRPNRVLYNTVRGLRRAVTGYLLAQSYDSLGDITFFSTLGIKSVMFDSAISRFSFVTNLFFIIFGVSLIYLYIWLIRSLRSLTKKRGTETESTCEARNKFMKKIESLEPLYKEFKDDSILQQGYLLIFFARNVLVSAVIGTLNKHPLVQCILLVLTSVSIMLYLLIIKPFRNFFSQLQQYFFEGVLLVTNTCILIMASLDEMGNQAMTTRIRLGKCIIVLGLTYNVVVVLITGFQVVLTLVKGVKSLREWRRRRVISILPASEEISAVPCLTYKEVSSLQLTKLENRIDINMRNDKSSAADLSNLAKILPEPFELLQGHSDTSIINRSISLHDNSTGGILNNNESFIRRKNTDFIFPRQICITHNDSNTRHQMQLSGLMEINIGLTQQELKDSPPKRRKMET